MTDPSQDLRFEAKVSNLGRLFQLLTNIFGQAKQMQALARIDGEEVLGVFPKLGGRSVTLKASNCHIQPYLGKSEHAAAQIVFNVPDEAIVPLFCDVIRTKASFLGLLKLVFKYLLTRKVILKGSLGVSLKFIRALMVGAHSMYGVENQSPG